ncbi:vesicle-associated membrane protein 2-like [Heteronotia binoei]|uniref:vesicle-associated membrane protein 2-like n=1 Tax=Heteronotia binoei TaxID=13085 RepID=UPI00293183D1|nr:vesicle-associated membrane protein 2-like [Heteronotia binoei]
MLRDLRASLTPLHLLHQNMATVAKVTEKVVVDTILFTWCIVRLSPCDTRSDPAQPPHLEAEPEGGESSGGPPPPPPNLTSNRRLQQTQAEVNQVVDILHDNMTRVIQRDEALSSLDDKADSLHESAKIFENSTTALARKYWCQNMKMMIILGLICGIAAIAIIVYFFT